MHRMKIVKTASAGTLESSDVYVEVAPGDGLSVKIDSVVKAQFGDAIEAAVLDVCTGLGVAGADLYVSDRGALDCTVRARVEAALRRAGEGAQG